MSVRVSLRGGRGRHEGRVEVTRNNNTGTICDRDFDDREAKVICRMLGYRSVFINEMSIDQESA